ncbi:MAG TPA: acyl-CoA dehydrogenase [Rhizomicrobium sp.]|jgi:alkylation response protein AidB-like acyl-CoA dehydrogenase
MGFRAPVRDIAFALRETAGLNQLLASDAFSGFDSETLTAILDAAGEFAEGVLAPLNRSGDLEGARFENGRVFAPAGFADAYRRYSEGGWTSLAAPPEFGGQGLPRALALAVFEIVHAANMSFGLCPMLSEAAIHLLTAHGSPAQKRRYLPQFVSGRWTGTMNLTEAQAGSDLALIRTRAELDGEKFRVTGQKIFITWGDHDCAENIVHLVLARLPGAPEGTKGISLFLVPKQLVGEDGKAGAANALRPLSIERKLGIHGSPTCVMSYEGAEAELVGAPHQGLALMFTMMNAARLNVGMEGVGIAERAFQQARDYALERRQGRSPWSGEAPARIADLPDVRRMLMLMKAKTEAARAICLSAAVASDLAEHAATPELREAARLREELLVPVAKAWSTDIGVEVASLGVQVHGGAGFIEETGAAQFYRDARIAPIYEGTNGIQAIDLVGRKLALAGGAPLRALLAEMRETAAQLDDRLVASPLAGGVDAVERATAWLLDKRGSVDALAGATTYLKLLGDVTGGWLLAKAALAAAKSGDAAFAQQKLVLARFYAGQILTSAPGLAQSVVSGAADLEAGAELLRSE